MKSKLLLLEKRLSELAKNYRSEWKEELWESEKIEEFGLNEFIGGKADAYEDCLDLIKELKNNRLKIVSCEKTRSAKATLSGGV